MINIYLKILGGKQIKLKYSVDFYEELMEKHNASNIRFFCIETNSATEVVDKIIEKSTNQIGNFRDDEFFDMGEYRNYLFSIIRWSGQGIYDMCNLDIDASTTIGRIEVSSIL